MLTQYLYYFFYSPQFTTLAVLERFHAFVTVSSGEDSLNGDSTSVLRENSNSFYYIPFPKKHYYSSLIVYKGLIMLSLSVFTSLVVVLTRWLENGQYTSCCGMYLFWKLSPCCILLPHRHCVCISKELVEQAKSSFQLVISTFSRESRFAKLTDSRTRWQRANISSLDPQLYQLLALWLCVGSLLKHSALECPHL